MSEYKQIPRFQYPLLLAKKFVDDFNEVLTHYSHTQQIELTEHILQVLALLGEFAISNDEQTYKKFQTLEDELLKKYRNKLKPYLTKQFYKYFWFDMIMFDKEIISAETYKAMQPQEQRLTADEVKRFVQIAQNTLHQQRQYLYLQETEQTEPELTVKDIDEPDKEITKARQLLAIYYFLKAAFGIDGRKSNSISEIARFIHLLTGTKFTTIQNSDIYKKYQKMPNYKKDSHLIDDLKFIRPYFVDLGLESAVKMINDEIKTAISEMPYSERKKLEDKG